MPRISGFPLDHEPPTAVHPVTTAAPPGPVTHLVRWWPVRLMAAGMVLVVAGCGTNLDEVVYQTIAAAGRTYVDLVLTDVANDLAGVSEDDADDDTNDTDGTNGDGGNGDAGLDGAALFASNGCNGCHGEDGASGSAPDISGKAAAEVATGLELPIHTAISLSEEEIAAIAEFLGASAGGIGNGPDAGEQLYMDLVCAACHCADASGGCALDAPSLVGVDLDELEDTLVGDDDHPGGKFDLSAEDLQNLEAYLASL